MIRQILLGLTALIERQNGRDRQAWAATRRFNIAIVAATKKNDSDIEAMREIARLAGAALQASDRDDTEALNRITTQLQEWTR